jgi:hypothetical protein
MAEDVTKLPGWAQRLIRDLQRQRDTAVEALHRYQDDQTESDIWTDDLLCVAPGSPERSLRFIQARSIYFRTHKDGVSRDRSEVQIHLGRDEKSHVVQVTFGSHVVRPTASNSIEIIAVANAWGL